MNEHEDEEWVKEAIAKIRKSVDGDECHVCGGKIEKKIQVRPCVYAEPCQHRLYQGRAN